MNRFLFIMITFFLIFTMVADIQGNLLGTRVSTDTESTDVLYKILKIEGNYSTVFVDYIDYDSLIGISDGSQIEYINIDENLKVSKDIFDFKDWLYKNKNTSEFQILSYSIMDFDFDNRTEIVISFWYKENGQRSYAIVFIDRGKIDYWVDGYWNFIIVSPYSDKISIMARDENMLVFAENYTLKYNISFPFDIEKISTIDFDGDNKTEVVLLNGENQILIIKLYDLSFWKAMRVIAVNGQANYFYSSDWDLDGKEELFIAEKESILICDQGEQCLEINIKELLNRNTDFTLTYLMTSVDPEYLGSMIIFASLNIDSQQNQIIKLKIDKDTVELIKTFNSTNLVFDNFLLDYKESLLITTGDKSIKIIGDNLYVEHDDIRYVGMIGMYGDSQRIGWFRWGW